MSEQVGASLVLAQMLLPSQVATPVQNALASPSENAPPGADGSQQLIDSIGESAPAFASLLTELTNLEVRSATTTALPAEDLIRVRVATAAQESPLPATGTDLPETGKLLPAADGSALEIGSTPPLLSQTDARATLPEPSVLDDAEIVVREAVGSATPPRQPTALESLPAPISQPAAEAVLPQSPATSSAAAPLAAQLPPTATTDPSLRPGDAQAPATAAATFAGNGANTSGDPNNGQNPANGQSDRQAHPNPGPRGPSISFSQEGLPSATVAAPTVQAGLLPTSGSPALSQPLALLGPPAQWAEPLAERLAGLATRGANTAEIRLHPPSLGALEVRITLANDQATLFVASASPEVREALQQALPRLDNLLNDLGIELAESEIAERQADGFQRDGEGGQQGDPEATGTASEPQIEQAVSDRLGLLDTWA